MKMKNYKMMRRYYPVSRIIVLAIIMVMVLTFVGFASTDPVAALQKADEKIREGAGYLIVMAAVIGAIYVFWSTRRVWGSVLILFGGIFVGVIVANVETVKNIMAGIVQWIQ